MGNFEEKRDQKIFEITIILKLIYIVLGVIAILSVNRFKIKDDNFIYIAIVSSIVLIMIICYFLWIGYRDKTINPKYSKQNDFIEISLLFLIFIIVMATTKLQDSDYKLISIFIVLISAIQFGRKYSICIAVATSTFIMSLNCIMNDWNKIELSTYFEKDLVLITTLIVISFIVGLYVDIEKEHSKELKELANIDELTGLYNHRYFQEHLENSMINADKKNEEVSLLFMDIDYFKNFNDINGHQAGDLALRQIGDILKECVRKDDIVARYGGEEFAVILPNTKEEDAIKVGQRIRESVQNTYFIGQENQPGKNMTMSIGVSSYPRRASSKHQFINTADDALYRAKAFNKNRVEAYHNVLDGICETMHIKEDTTKSLKAFISMINIKDRYTYGHTERVVIYTKWFAEYLNLNEEEKLQLQISAYLHDIGKLEIPEEVLNKKEKLTKEEFQMFREHPQAGVDLIKNISQFKPLTYIIKHHHERYDGAGYPDGLKGNNIPYLARVMTIADSFDAMTSNRPYNKRKTHTQGIQELRDNAGSQFDPILVEQFIEMLKTYKDNF